MKLNAIELPPRAPGLSRTLILLHGYGADERDLLPIELGRHLRGTLEALGVDVEWHEYPMEHMVIPEEIEDARRWLNARL